MEISEFSLPPFPSISLYPNREQKDKTENFQRQLFHTIDESIYPPFILKKKKDRTPSHRNRFPKQKKKIFTYKNRKYKQRTQFSSWKG